MMTESLGYSFTKWIVLILAKMYIILGLQSSQNYRLFLFQQ